MGYFQRPLITNDGNNIHLLPEDGPTTTHIDKFLVCYDRKYPTQLGCECILNQNRQIWYPEPYGQRAEVKNRHWFVKDENPYAALLCSELKEEPGLVLPFGVDLAKGVKLKAKKNKDAGVDLTLTTDSEKGTAAFFILRGNQLRPFLMSIITIQLDLRRFSLSSTGSPSKLTSNASLVIICGSTVIMID